ncbi:MAG: hypothetical protein CBD97_01960 [Pelagibacteraceae bacterium TMED237]|nr:MAG: hypothetical protein CBD97_01960 [Pelagibacteraceae bacterium TMED237]|tara:strand:+ start:1958 stop:3361 length:1404 start_codon:yes stop_codon:yes gene_type:complete
MGNSNSSNSSSSSSSGNLPSWAKIVLIIIGGLLFCGAIFLLTNLVTTINKNPVWQGVEDVMTTFASLVQGILSGCEKAPNCTPGQTSPEECAAISPACTYSETETVLSGGTEQTKVQSCTVAKGQGNTGPTKPSCSLFVGAICMAGLLLLAPLARYLYATSIERSKGKTIEDKPKNDVEADKARKAGMRDAAAATGESVDEVTSDLVDADARSGASGLGAKAGMMTTTDSRLTTAAARSGASGAATASVTNRMQMGAASQDAISRMESNARALAQHQFETDARALKLWKGTDSEAIEGEGDSAFDTGESTVPDAVKDMSFMTGYFSVPDHKAIKFKEKINLEPQISDIYHQNNMEVPERIPYNVFYLLSHYNWHHKHMENPLNKSLNTSIKGSHLRKGSHFILRHSITKSNNWHLVPEKVKKWEQEYYNKHGHHLSLPKTHSWAAPHDKFWNTPDKKQHLISQMNNR